MVAVGPHGSTTPVPTLQKLGVDVVVIGECEEILLTDRRFQGADFMRKALREQK